MPEKPDQAKFTAEVYPTPTRVPRRHPDLSLPPEERYVVPNDVPVPLRHNIRYAHETGVSTEHLAIIYDMPREWIMLFVQDSAGSA